VTPNSTPTQNPATVTQPPTLPQPPTGLAAPAPTGPDPLESIGKKFGRYGEAFHSLRAIINAGLSRDEGDDPNGFTTIEQSQWEAWKTFTSMFPTMETRLLNEDSEPELNRILRGIKAGCQVARSNNIAGIRKCIPNYRGWTPPLAGRPKVERGFNHPETGKLLFPAFQGWNPDSLNSSEYLAYRDGLAQPDPWVFPLVLFKDEVYDPREPLKGFLQNTLVVQIFIGPSAALVDNMANYRSTRQGNAEIHGMTSVTIPSIVYAATLVRFALSSETIFNLNNTRSFQYGEFYRTIVDFLQGEDAMRHRERLLIWWNNTIYPTNNLSHGPPGGTIAAMMAQIQSENEAGDIGDN